MRDKELMFLFRGDVFRDGKLMYCNSRLWLGASVVNADTGDEFVVTGELGGGCYSIAAATSE